MSTTLLFSLTAAITSHICFLAKGSMPYMEREWRRESEWMRKREKRERERERESGNDRASERVVVIVRVSLRS